MQSLQWNGPSAHHLLSIKYVRSPFSRWCLLCLNVIRYSQSARAFFPLLVKQYQLLLWVWCSALTQYLTLLRTTTYTTTKEIKICKINIDQLFYKLTLLWLSLPFKVSAVRIQLNYQSQVVSYPLMRCTCGTMVVSVLFALRPQSWWSAGPLGFCTRTW